MSDQLTHAIDDFIEANKDDPTWVRMNEEMNKRHRENIREHEESRKDGK